MNGFPQRFSHNAMYSFLRSSRLAKYFGYCAFSNGCQESNTQSGGKQSRSNAVPPGEDGTKKKIVYTWLTV